MGWADADVLQGGDDDRVAEQRRAAAAELHDRDRLRQEVVGGLGVNSDLHVGLASPDLGEGIEEEAGKGIGGVIASRVDPAEGDGLADGVAAEAEVDPLGVERDRLATLELETRQKLDNSGLIEGFAAVKLSRWGGSRLFIEREQDLIEPTERQPLLIVLQVQGDMNQPAGLQALL